MDAFSFWKLQLRCAGLASKQFSQRLTTCQILMFARISINSQNWRFQTNEARNRSSRYLPPPQLCVRVSVGCNFLGPSELLRLGFEQHQIRLKRQRSLTAYCIRPKSGLPLKRNEHSMEIFQCNLLISNISLWEAISHSQTEIIVCFKARLGLSLKEARCRERLHRNKKRKRDFRSKGHFDWLRFDTVQRELQCHTWRL